MLFGDVIKSPVKYLVGLIWFGSILSYYICDTTNTYIKPPKANAPEVYTNKSTFKTDASYIQYEVGEKHGHMFVLLYDYMTNGHKTNLVTYYSTNYGESFSQISLKNEYNTAELDYVKFLHDDIVFASSYAEQLLFLTDNTSKVLSFKYYSFKAHVVEAKNCKTNSEIIAIQTNTNNITELYITWDMFGKVYNHSINVIDFTCLDIDVIDNKVVAGNSFLIYAKNTAKNTIELININSKNEIKHLMVVDNLQIVDSTYYFVTITKSNSVKLEFSKNGFNYRECKFPKRLTAKKFTVLNIDKYNEIYVSVTTTNDATSLYVANENDLKFVKILSNIYNNNIDENACSSVSFTNGAPGTIMATLKSPIVNDGHHYQSVISFDNGNTWNPVFILEEDLNSNFPNCKNKNCTVRLSLDCKVHNTDNLINAPWIVVAWGKIVDQSGNPVHANEDGIEYEGTFISHDGGLIWRTFFKTMVHISILNHGSVIVANTQRTNELSISYDEGLTWVSLSISNRKQYILHTYVLPNEDEIKFGMFSQIFLSRNIFLYVFNFKPALERNCVESDFDDFKLYYTESESCYRGNLRVFRRKKHTSKCIINNTHVVNIYNITCSCTIDDFTCDFGFMKTNNGECIPDPDDDQSKDTCSIDIAGKIIYSGYKSLDFDSCGINYGSDTEAKTHSDVCYFTSDTSFLLISGVNSIVIIPQSLPSDIDKYVDFKLLFNKNISNIQVDFGMNCLYGVSEQKLVKYCWSHQAQFRIGMFAAVPFVEENIISIQFDYITRNLYVLTVDNVLKLYQLDKSLYKTLSINNTIKISQFKINMIMGYIGYKILNDSKLYVMLSNGSNMDSYSPIECADFFEMDNFNNKLVVLCKNNSTIRYYNSDGKSYKTLDKLKVPTDLIDMAYGDKAMYFLTPSSLIITDMEGKQSTHPYKYSISLLYHSKAITPIHHCLFNSCEHICFNHENDGSCACMDGYKLSSTSSYKKCVPIDNKCKTDEFECKNNGKCISNKLVCNHYDDCGDYSDELNCLTNCGVNEYKCDTVEQCIHKSDVCNGKVDCSDGSDEVGCVDNFHCKKNEFDCLDGKCIDRSLICNRIDDCDNGLDEIGCEHVCTEKEYHCISGECINKFSRCNDIYECRDGSDEFNCYAHVCEFRCGTYCLQSSDVCNGVIDCVNGEDETRCNEHHSGKHTTAIILSCLFVGLVIFAFIIYKFGIYSKLRDIIFKKHGGYQPIKPVKYYDHCDNSGLLSDDHGESDDEDFFY